MKKKESSRDHNHDPLEPPSGYAPNLFFSCRMLWQAFITNRGGAFMGIQYLAVVLAEFPHLLLSYILY